MARNIYDSVLDIRCFKYIGCLFYGYIHSMKTNIWEERDYWLSRKKRSVFIKLRFFSFYLVSARKLSIFKKWNILDEIFIFWNELMLVYQRIEKGENIAKRNISNFVEFFCWHYLSVIHKDHNFTFAWVNQYKIKWGMYSSPVKL